MTDTPDPVAEKLAQADLPPDILAWLARFKLLLGVPFQYLVPDETMLPPESLKFFNLDEDWIDALLDGALSVGRVYSGTETGTVPAGLADLLHHENLHRQANGQVHHHREMQLSQEPSAATPSAKLPTISGFLLRSDVVRGWKGLDFSAYPKGASPYDYSQGIVTAASDVKALDILRLEPLSDTVLLGLFSGQVFELVVHQPPEAIHFGFLDVDLAKGTVVKTLRVPRKTWNDPGGYSSDTYGEFTLSGCFSDLDRRVLSMAALSKGLADSLAGSKVNKPPGYYRPDPAKSDTEKYHYKDHLLSSDFAMEMVQGVGLVSFINHPEPEA